MSRTSVAFRVDADADIGIGHLRRCLTLAAALKQRGCDIRFVTRHRLRHDLAPALASYSTGALERMPGEPDGGDLSSERGDAERTLALLGHPPTDSCWVVIDSYRLGRLWERTIRSAGFRICAIDDYRNRLHHADLLVSDSELPFDPALNDVGGTSRHLVGRRYALLDADFRAAEYAPSTGPIRVLVCYGGSDPTGETLKGLAALRILGNDRNLCERVGRIDVVVGPANRHVADVERAIEQIRDAVVHRAPPSLPPLMRMADLVLTAGGNTMIEALALRRTCIVTVTGDHQASMVARLKAEELIYSLGGHAATTPNDVLAMLARALNEGGSMAARIRSVAPFDHLGAGRVADAMLAPAAPA